MIDMRPNHTPIRKGSVIKIQGRNAITTGILDGSDNIVKFQWEDSGEHDCIIARFKNGPNPLIEVME